MGRRGADYDRSNERDRRLRRSNILAKLGYTGTLRNKGAQSPRRYADLLSQRGVDPLLYAEDLHIPQHGGRAKTDEPNAVLRQKRYRYCREVLGMGCDEATDTASNQGRFAREVRLRRFRGEPLQPVPPEIAEGVAA